MAKQDPFEKYILPKGIEDRALATTLKTFASAMPPLGIWQAISGLVLWHLDAPFAASCNFTIAAVALSCLPAVRMGFVRWPRYIFFTTMTVLLGMLSFSTGFQNLWWIYFISNATASFFMTTPKEKNFRNYTFFLGGGMFFVTMIGHAFGVVSPELNPEHWMAIRLYCSWNAVYGSMLLLGSVIQYQMEVKQYKKLLEDQSMTMVQHAKMSSLGEMAAGVAHEINNPLGVIIGKIETMENRMAEKKLDVEKFVSDFGKIKTVVMRIAKIVSALRTFSRNADNDPFQETKVSAIIEDTLNFCSENLRLNHVEIRIMGDQNFQIQCRSSQISQVLVNLINNSFEAVLKLPEKWIEIKCEEIGSRLQLSVTDSGRGIPPAIAEKIMQPFFTTKEIGKGTGLGLSVARGIAEAHSGALSLDMSSEHTRFVLDLPLQAQLVESGKVA